jgi:hypothetical protein
VRTLRFGPLHVHHTGSGVRREDTRRFWTVWEFSGATIPQPPVTVARIAEPNDVQVSHSYQKVLGQTLAFTPAEALGIVAAQRSKM